MKKIFCSLAERFVNPLFEVFDGGDFILSSYRDIEEPLTQVQIFFEDGPGLVDDAKRRLSDALAVVGVETKIEVGEIPDEDWKLAYRRHFKIDPIGERLLIVPTWELDKVGETDREIVTLDPGMAFGTGKHETTRACLEFIEESAKGLGGLDGIGGLDGLDDPSSTTPKLTKPPKLSKPLKPSFLDMGCGSGILSIAAAKLGFAPVTGFDVDQEAIDASNENATLNFPSQTSTGNRQPATVPTFFKYGLGAKVRRELPPCDLVAANILGPLLIRFADEIVPTVKSRLIISGILTELYPEVLAAYTSRGLAEVKRKTIGEWTTGLLTRP